MRLQQEGPLSQVCRRLSIAEDRPHPTQVIEDGDELGRVDAADEAGVR